MDRLIYNQVQLCITEKRGILAGNDDLDGRVVILLIMLLSMVKIMPAGGPGQERPECGGSEEPS